MAKASKPKKPVLNKTGKTGGPKKLVPTTSNLKAKVGKKKGK